VQPLLQWKINENYIVCVALLIQHALLMRRLILSSAACLTLQNVSTLPHQRHDFRKKDIQHKLWVEVFSTILF
jgi:hypothetical protein